MQGQRVINPYESRWFWIVLIANPVFWGLSCLSALLGLDWGECWAHMQQLVHMQHLAHWGQGVGGGGAGQGGGLGMVLVETRFTEVGDPAKDPGLLTAVVVLGLYLCLTEHAWALPLSHRARTPGAGVQDKGPDQVCWQVVVVGGNARGMPKSALQSHIWAWVMLHF